MSPTTSLFSIVAGLLLIGLVPLWLTFMHHRVERDRHKLFRVRAELVQLVATDKVSPDDDVFRSLYELLNLLIANTQIFGLLAFLSYAQRTHIPSHIEELLQRIHRDRQELQPVTQHFCITLRDILWTNRVLWWRLIHGLVILDLRVAPPEFRRAVAAAARLRALCEQELQATPVAA